MSFGDVPLHRLVRFAWLGVVVVAIAVRPGRPAVTLPLLVLAAGTFVVWRRAHRPLRAHRAAASLLALGAAAAGIAAFAPAAVGLLAAVGVAAALTFPLAEAAAIAAAGPILLAGAATAEGWSTSLVAGGAAAALGGLLGGLGRRQAQQRADQEARVRLARELHDVLAHTLGALAVQLEAAETVRERGDEAKLAELLRRSRTLVASGLEEAAEAVRALRDEPVPILDRLAALAAGDGVDLRVDGTPRPLPPEAGLALYRAAQEALTNARKHAPGAPPELVLRFGDGETTVTVRNDAVASSRRAPGAGLGLQGMRERLELVGGRLEAGSRQGSWTVEAAVPA